MIKISVIVPVYNVKSYIAECLESLVRQSVSEIEVIIVDDGSTDGSGEIAQEYADKYDYFRLIRQENGGLSAARNTGIEHANGEYIYFLDSDDYLTDHALETLYDIASEKQLDVLKFVAYSFSDEESEPEWSDDYKYKGIYDGVYSGQEILQLFIDNGDTGYPNCGLIFTKREIIEANHLRFERGIIHEDNLFHWKLLALSQRVAVYNQTLHCRRYRPGSIVTTPNYEKKLWSMYRSAVEAEHFLMQHVDLDGETTDYYINFYIDQFIGAWKQTGRERQRRDDIRGYVDELKPISRKHGYNHSGSVRLFMCSRTLFRWYCRCK